MEHHSHGKGRQEADIGHQRQRMAVLVFGRTGQESQEEIQEKWGEIQGQWLKAVICLAAKVS
jgi:hypothetical protein